MLSPEGKECQKNFDRKVGGVVKLGVKSKEVPEDLEKNLVKTHKFCQSMNLSPREILLFSKTKES